MNYSPGYKGRCFVATVQIGNMENAGLTKEQYEDPEFLAQFLVNTWESSGKNRTAGVSICVSEKGLYHAHMALYGNLTTLKNVSEILFKSHVEPQLGGKQELTDYLLKQGKYDEKGEKVLFSLGLDNIQDNQGKRSDLERISELLESGLTPHEIFEESLSYRKYEKMVLSAYRDKLISEMPIEKEMHNEYHCGASGSGKTYYYVQLVKELGADQIYLVNDLQNGGFDLYMEMGAPPVLFIDELKPYGGITYGMMLTITGNLSRYQTHSRFKNAINAWDRVIVTSVYPIEEMYASWVEGSKKEIDSFEQLLRRFEKIVYHYKDGDEYKTYEMPASKYKNYKDLVNHAKSSIEGFTLIDEQEEIPF